MSFQIPLHFEDLARSTGGSWQPNTSTLRHQPVDSLLELLEHDLEPIFHSPPSSQFNALYSLITRYQTLNQKHRTALLSLIDTLPRLITRTDPNHIKVALYFVAGLAAAASSAPCKAFDKSRREGLLETALALIVGIPTPCPFPDNDRDQLASQMVRLVLNILEAQSAARHKTARPVLARCLAAALSLDQRQILPTSTALLHALNRHEHIPVPLAETLALLAQEGDVHKQFVSQFVREIATLSSEHLTHDTMAAKSIAAFVADLSERLPDVFRSNLALVLSQLDADSYMLRNGIVHVIGALIRAEPNADDPLLDVLLERSHRDINAFTRSKGLQTWISLAEAKVVPNRLYPTLADMAASRLDDKAAAVRKYAAQLLSSLLENNPYGPALRVTHFRENLKELTGIDKEEIERPSEVEENEASSEVTDIDPRSVTEAKSDDEGNESETEKEGDSEDHSENGQEVNVDTNGTDNVEANSDETQQAEDSPSEEDAEKALKVTYYSTAVSFITAVESGLETVYDMLRSKSVTDVSEGVSLLITAIQFQLEAASGRAVRKMLPLVLARETNTRQAAVQAYVRLLAPGGIDTVHDKEPAMAVAKGLIALGVGATTGEIACLEALISAMCSSDTANVLSSAVVAVLWDMFAGRVPGACTEQRRAACMLIGMVAAEKPDTLEQRLQTMETVGIQNPAFARWACVALCKLPHGSDPQNSLLERVAVLAKSSTDLPTVEQAVTAIFYVSSKPEEILGQLVRDLAKALYDSPSSVQVPDLCRFLLVIGQVAVKELVRIESLVAKVRQGIASQARKDGDDNEEEEQAVAEAEKALELAEKELVSPKSLLGRFGNLARKVAADQSAPAELQASAVLCMAKLMCVEESFCEKNLRLLFSILNSSPEPVVRSNSVTALGDLAFRFPNLVEPWSSHIYGALRDKDDKVRKNTLMALSHLILNDMIKVKGQIVGIAVCILDENERIADLARLFFNELARKSSNVIYNILPDTISCLSKMDSLASDSFKRVVSFLVGLMDKEKHSDSMVEKLCHRFRTCEGERETQDLAFCISMLNMSERGIKKLADNFKSYSSVLNDDMVHSYITGVISKCTKPGISPTCTQIIEELTKKIEAIRATAGDDDASSSVTRLTEGSESHSSRRRSTRANQKSSRSRGRPKRHSVVEEQVSDQDDNAESEEAVVKESVEDTEETLTRSRRSSRSTRRKRIVEEEVSDDDSEEEEQDFAEQDDNAESEEAVVEESVADTEETPTRARRLSRSTRRKRIVQEEVTDDEYEEEEQEFADESEEEDEDASDNESDEVEE